MWQCKHCGNKPIGPLYRSQIYCNRKCAARAREGRNRARGGSQSKDKRIDRNREFIYQDKLVKGCSRCSERRPHALQYHHLNRATKTYDISQMLHRRLALRRIQCEVSKCILLCGNCHLVEENDDGYKDSDRPIPVQVILPQRD